MMDEDTSQSYESSTGTFAGMCAERGFEKTRELVDWKWVMLLVLYCRFLCKGENASGV